MRSEDGVRVRELGTAPLRIAITDAPDEVADPRVDAAWTGFCEHHSRLHDGPILLVDGERFAAGQLACRVGSYKSLATASMVGAHVRALGVCGWLVAHDSGGRPHILFARRSSEVRMYPGLWENAPSGAVAPPRLHGAELTLADLVAALAEEGAEELGLDLRSARATALATLEDDAAGSIDVVLRVELPQVIDPRAGVCAARDGRWEYVDTAWVAADELVAWASRAASAISPPTRALIQRSASEASGASPT